MVDIGGEPSSPDTGCKQTLHIFNAATVAATGQAALALQRQFIVADRVRTFDVSISQWCPRPAAAVAMLATAALCGCVSAPPPGPSLLALPGTSRSPAQFEADDARCRSSAAAQAGLPANVAASNPTAGVLAASQSAQERYDASYAGCMSAAGEQIPATQPPGADTPGITSTVDPYAYGGYGNAANVPVTTAIATGPIYTGWGWGWGWDGWYGGFTPAYAYGSYGYTPWVPFGVSVGWGYYGGWGYRGWGYRGWGAPGWGRPGWGGGWGRPGWGRPGWGRPGWGRPGWGGGYHGGGFHGGGPHR